MRWEHLTSPDFARGVKDTGVCILVMGVLERHADHLPLGTDYINGHKLAEMASEQEPAMVFPPFYFGQIYEARCYPGTVTLKPSLLLDLVQSVMDEIGRNGFKKIILFNAHGGNMSFLPFLAQCSLWEEKPYSVYYHTWEMSPEDEKNWNALLDTTNHNHACECETSISLANHPELVHMDRVPAEPADPLNRLNIFANFSGISWYANYPEHYAGDARTATAEKGRALQQIKVKGLVDFIRAVKQDQVVPALSQEFFERVRKVSGQ
jgi:creatinine amidohydrolase